MTSAAAVPPPGEVSGLVSLDQLVVHGWDIAAATGQPYSSSDEEVDTATSFVVAFDAVPPLCPNRQPSDYSRRDHATRSTKSRLQKVVDRDIRKLVLLSLTNVMRGGVWWFRVLSGVVVVFGCLSLFSAIRGLRRESVPER